MNNTVQTLLTGSAMQLREISDTPLLDCQLLLGHVLKKNRAWLYAHAGDTPAADRAGCFGKLLARRIKGEPIAYITGRKPFWNLELTVTPDTLIPRPETELLVETLLDRFDNTPMEVADLGAGTGAIAISLAGERPAWQVTGVDNNPAALQIARLNGQCLPNLHWRLASWCTGCQEVDLIVSNPPYIPESDPHLAQLRFEPVSALAAGPDGLDAIREIIRCGHSCLKPQGHMIVEHGHDQQARVVRLFKAAGYRRIKCFKDIHGTPRAVMAGR